MYNTKITPKDKVNQHLHGHTPKLLIAILLVYMEVGKSAALNSRLCEHLGIQFEC